MLKLPDESFLEIFGVWKYHLRVAPSWFQLVDAQHGNANLSVNFDFDPKNYAWLRCNKQYMGKTLVRKGKRIGLPETNEKEPKWVFCPMAQTTLQLGVEGFLKKRIPEIKWVEAI